MLVPAGQSCLGAASSSSSSPAPGPIGRSDATGAAQTLPGAAPAITPCSAGSRAKGWSITSVFIWGSAGWLLPHCPPREPFTHPVPRGLRVWSTPPARALPGSGCEPAAGSSPWFQPHCLGRAGFASSQAQGQAQALQHGRRGSGCPAAGLLPTNSPPSGQAGARALQQTPNQAGLEKRCWELLRHRRALGLVLNHCTVRQQLGMAAWWLSTPPARDVPRLAMPFSKA